MTNTNISPADALHLNWICEVFSGVWEMQKDWGGGDTVCPLAENVLCYSVCRTPTLCCCHAPIWNQSISLWCTLRCHNRGKLVRNPRQAAKLWLHLVYNDLTGEAFKDIICLKGVQTTFEKLQSQCHDSTHAVWLVKQLHYQWGGYFNLIDSMCFMWVTHSPLIY